MPRRLWAAGAIGIAAAVAVSTVTVVHHERAEAQERAVEALLPAPDTPVRQVLLVYLRAAKAHQCRVTAALMAPDGPERDAPWCGTRRHTWWSDDDPDLVSYGNVGRTSHVSAEHAPAAEECIPVDIVQKGMSGADPGSLPGWEFCFTHTADGWRLFDEGYG
ncbi:hypothetical protein [Curtobacterium sp. MCBD17_003]|uniref:hypothetical protein n=1 Tax=Curtobacterium sp. MCBD17_003 TaxID=2175667 RepID=UPI000DA7FDBB|nr:hypothetical protein [Curtobacterium sp. MCBD17_003]WIE55625.1 hypothetical protein DEI88_005345 [Curtobacterium sp. MCBD17_003]